MNVMSSKVSNIKLLRKRGLSIPEISQLTGLAKSTILRHVKNVAILPRFYPRWLERRNASKLISQRYWKEAERFAQEEVPMINKEHLAVIGAALYWAEGSKKDFSFSNTDPQMIQTFINILRKVYDVREDDFKFSLRLYEDLNKKKCIEFWSKVLGVNLKNKHVTLNILEGSKKGKFEYGMCRIRVKKGGLLLKKIVSITKYITTSLEPS